MRSLTWYFLTIFLITVVTVSSYYYFFFDDKVQEILDSGTRPEWLRPKGTSKAGNVSTPEEKKKLNKIESEEVKMPLIDWKTEDFLKEPLPDDLTSEAKEVQPTTHRLQLQKYDVFYRQALPPNNVASSNQELLLLHGMRFKSQTWLDLNTINLLAAMGHKVTAIDLPGYGESSKEHVPEDQRGEFLHQVITGLKLNQPVIVSPSLSGSFTVPLLKSHPEDFGGYIPVAPIMTGKLTAEEYKKIKVPTLIIYGEKDKDLGTESVNNLGNIQTSQVRMLPAAGHPAYLDQPEMFHQLIFNFMKIIK